MKASFTRPPREPAGTERPRRGLRTRRTALVVALTGAAVITGAVVLTDTLPFAGQRPPPHPGGAGPPP
ncbi:M1 family metallopeptidase, partial [Streptomyces sp. NPDC000851]